MDTIKHETQKCVTCGKKLRVFEYNICSCGFPVCIRHITDHGCNKVNVIKTMERCVSHKVSKI